MAIKKWLITAEVNMDAGHHASIVVEANSSRKAIIIGKKKLLESYFYVSITKCELMKGVDGK